MSDLAQKDRFMQFLAVLQSSRRRGVLVFYSKNILIYSQLILSVFSCFTLVIIKLLLSFTDYFVSGCDLRSAVQVFVPLLLILLKSSFQHSFSFVSDAY